MKQDKFNLSLRIQFCSKILKTGFNWYRTWNLFLSDSYAIIER